MTVRETRIPGGRLPPGSALLLTRGLGLPDLLGGAVAPLGDAELVAPQLDVQALPADAQHLGGRGPVVAGGLQGCLDEVPLHQVRGIPDQVLQGDALEPITGTGWNIGLRNLLGVKARK